MPCSAAESLYVLSVFNVSREFTKNENEKKNENLAIS